MLSAIGYAAAARLCPRDAPSPFWLPAVRSKAALTTGKTLDGTVIGEDFSGAQLRTSDNHIHLLRKTEAGKFREVTSQIDWSTYNGDPSGNRFTKLTQIDKSNVNDSRRAGSSMCPTLMVCRCTPIVAGRHDVCHQRQRMLCAGCGQRTPVWHFQRPRTKGLVGNAAGGFNRGVALARRQGLHGDR